VRLEKLQDTREHVVTEELPEDEPAKGRYFNVREVCMGVKTWVCPDNGFTVVRLHYTADPRKRTADWKRAARSGLTYAEWMREYEIQWSSFDGVPVYGDDFSRQFHVSDKPLEWQKGHPVVRGWDFGLGAGGMACVFAQLLPQSRLWLFKEITASDTDIEHFAPEVHRLAGEWFPGCVKWFDIVDPTGFNRSQINKLKSCTSVVNEKCFTHCEPGASSKLVRRRAVSKFLQRNVKGQPRFLVDSAGCPVTTAGFEGGYHYSFAKDGQLKDDPEKNEFSHPHDAVQMIASKIEKLDLSGPVNFNIPSPHYSFGRT
jgi:hypothetical protein